MSYALTAEAWKAPLGHASKIVLLALCEHANEAGECFPSVARLMRVCGMSERAIQAQIAVLHSAGYFEREARTGHSTVYRMSDPRTWCTPAGNAPPHDVPHGGAADAPLPPQEMHPTPAPRAPLSSKRTTESRGNAARTAATRSPRGSRLPPDWKPDDVLSAWAKKERPDLDIPLVVDMFRDYWVAASGSKGVKADWSATFRNWVRRQEARRSAPPTPARTLAV